MSDEPCFECGQPSTRAAWDGRYSVPCCDSEECRADIEADREDGPLTPAGPGCQKQLEAAMVDIAKLGVDLGCSSTAAPEVVFAAARGWRRRALAAERLVPVLNEIIEAGRAAHNDERVARDWLAREKARLEEALREALEKKR